MISPVSFRNSVFISLLGHITVFSIFSFSFGNRIPKANFTNVSFFGSILHSADLSNAYFNTPDIKIFSKKANISILDRIDKGYTLVSKQYFKPLVSLPINQEKIIFMQKVDPMSFIQNRKEPVMMFHPLLPYHFLLYFKDRQTVHIELTFNIIPINGTNSILVKRKISSGNLEVDLLSMRYICHYLFIQQARFIPNNWQTVEIDLSAKEN